MAKQGEWYGDWLKTDERVGKGGRADVFIAYRRDDIERAHPYALKRLRNASDNAAVGRFQKEINAALRLEHPGIVKPVFYDLGKRPFYVAPWYRKGHLTPEWSARLSPGQRLRFFANICRAVGYAHERGIIHRDLKPSNLLITKGGVAKLGDFGIAHLRDTPGLTQPGQTLGTLAYMSPEQIRGERLTPASDVFSLGIVLYELLTGQRPFVEDEAESVTAKIIADRPVPPRGVKSGIPRAVQRIVLKCLRKRPEQRFQTCSALERAIRRILGGNATDWEALLRRYLEALPAEGEAGSHLGRRLRTPGHVLRRLWRFSVAAGLAAAAAWGGLALTGQVSTVAPAVQWVQSLLPSVPSWRAPEASGPDRGVRPARPRPTRPPQRAPAPGR